MASPMVRPESEGFPDDRGGTPGVEVPIHSDHDVVEARRRGRSVAEGQGFSPVEVTLITTAISEVARNIVEYAGHGQVAVDVVEVSGRRAVQVVARDEGPGIPDVDLAMTDGYSTRRGLGLGLPGVRRLMDEVELHTGAGVGTTVVLRKWQGGHQPNRRRPSPLPRLATPVTSPAPAASAPPPAPAAPAAPAAPLDR